MNEPKLDKVVENSAEYWCNIFVKEFTKESDRAAVIITASIFDNTLFNLLKSFLIPNPTSNDELFETPNSPLANFSSKISFAYRLGLISNAFARNLHLIRKIRNEFAHNIHGGSFEESGVKSRVLELQRSQIYVLGINTRITHNFPNNSRGQFLMICSWMLWSLHSKIENIESLKEAEPEFGFIKKTEEE